MAGPEWGARAVMRDAMRTDKTGPAMKVENDEKDELAMPIVVSDVLNPPQARVKKTLASITGSPQTPASAGMSQPTAQPSPSPSRMRLAVHIRSSPVTPFTPINAPASLETAAIPSGLGRTRGQKSTSQTPIRPPTPDALAGLGTKVEPPGSGPKKRGRPKGWRKPVTPYSSDPNSSHGKRDKRAAESLAGEQNLGPGKSRGQAQEAKRRGRPPRPPEPSCRERYLQSNPYYVPFKCEWDLSEGSQNEPSICPAELQNMDTLRRHVFLIHGDMDPLICRFSRCRDLDQPLKFETEDAFEFHMETKHFASYSWHLGEGCQNNGIWTLKNKPDKLPAYLFDKNGNQVTPSVADQQIETDLQHKERKRKLRKLLHEQNENAPTEEEWKKQMLGVA
ncbi:hypothetical protein F5Y07DRAFT_357730 [Xylaria sp. FL0933]|nr:hypothetical protein F5Y07DRAFT_357730 [Xylaria sp. FL0933]